MGVVGMQNWHRKLQRSVTEMRSFRAVREKESVRAVTELWTPVQTTIVAHLNGISDVHASELN